MGGLFTTKTEEEETRESQMYGCFAYCDTIEEAKNMVNKVTDSLVKKITFGYDDIKQVNYIKVKYQLKSFKPQKINDFDDYTTRIDKVTYNEENYKYICLLEDVLKNKYNTNVNHFEEVSNEVE